jgi:hypothetical protein
MSNDVIFTAQLISIIVFIFSVFGIYRLLVSNKDVVVK